MNDTGSGGTWQSSEVTMQTLPSNTTGCVRVDNPSVIDFNAGNCVTPWPGGLWDTWQPYTWQPYECWPPTPVHVCGCCHAFPVTTVVCVSCAAKAAKEMLMSMLANPTVNGQTNTADLLLSQAKARLAAIDAELAKVDGLKAERAKLAKMIEAAS